MKSFLTSRTLSFIAGICIGAGLIGPRHFDLIAIGCACMCAVWYFGVKSLVGKPA